MFTSETSIHVRDMFSCAICQKTFLHQKNLRRHSKNVHGIHEEVQHTCALCGFGCRVKKQLRLHIRMNHDFKQKRGTRLKCPLCDTHVKTYQCLYKHLSEIHEFRIQEEYFEFENETEFRSWKLNVEKETQTQYCAERGLRKLKTCLQREYVCHRSYNPVLKTATERKRALKNLGTNKIGATCPSRMIVKFAPKNVQVHFVREHVGHSSEVIRWRLSADQRAEIARRLKEGVAVKKVLDDFRKSGDARSFDRLHYLKKKDIYNIIRDFSIGHTTPLCAEGTINVEMLVTTLENLQDSPILYHNFKDEDFSLIIMTQFQKTVLKALGDRNKICVDGMHGLNSNSYQLVSIFVIDKYNNGIPVAFSLSKKTDYTTMVSFFTKVREAIGFVIDCEVFMSNEAPQFQDAWTTVMGNPEHKLLCWWHINKDWNKNLNNKIKNVSKRNSIKKTLYSLATSTLDAVKFEWGLIQFVNDLKVDEDTQLFYDYFWTYYVPKKTSWAFCYRQYLALNNNTHLENLHRKIKHIYLEGKHGFHLDKTVNALLRLIEDMISQRIIKLTKKNQTDNIQKIIIGHRERVQIPNKDICRKEPELWHVKSQQDKRLIYKVKRSAIECPENNLCVLRCPDCNICIHTFQCSCIDNVVNLNICKHIHRVAEEREIITDDEYTNCESNDTNCESNDNLVHETIDLLETHPNPDNQKPIRSAEEVKKRLQVLLGLVDGMPNSEDNTKFVCKALDDLLICFNDEAKTK